MITSMIAAMAKNRVIGLDGIMPWHLPNDLKYFKATTLGHHIIMGRVTFESFAKKRPLPGRPNIVLSRNPDYEEDGVIAKTSLQEALEFCSEQGETEAFIIGGSQIYTEGLKVADRIYLTEIEAEFEGDTFFPEFGTVWKEVTRHHCEPDERNSYLHDFVVYERTFD